MNGHFEVMTAGGWREISQEYADEHIPAGIQHDLKLYLMPIILNGVQYRWVI